MPFRFVATDFDVAIAEATIEELGLGCRAPHPASNYYRWDYPTLDYYTPPPNPANKAATASIYRGIVPAKNILRRNLAINGAIVSVILTCSKCGDLIILVHCERWLLL